MVGGQFHHEGGGIAREGSGLFQDHARYDDRRHPDKVGGGSHQRRAAEDRAGDHRDKRHLRAAGNEGRGHDGHTAVALVFDGTRRHNPGDAAARADQHRDKGFARETEAPEDPVEHEGDTRHIAARLKDREKQEENEHLRDEAEHRADARDDPVEDQSREPVGGVRRVESLADQRRNTRYPRAEIGGIGFVKSAFAEVGDGVLIRHRVDLVPRVLRHRVEVDGDLGRFERFLVLDLDRGGRFGGFVEPGTESGERSVGIKVLGFGVNFDLERRRCVHRRLVISRGVLVLCRADTEHMPTVAEETVVRPVGRGGADRHHRDPVHKEHHEREDRKSEPAVGNDLIDLVRTGLPAGLFLLAARLDDAGYVEVAFVGDDALGVVAEFAFRRRDVLFDVRERLAGDLKVLEHFVVSLKDLDRVPALPLLGKTVKRRLFNVGERVFDGSGEGVLRDRFRSLCRLDRRLRRLRDPRPLQSRDRDHAATELARKFVEIDLVAVFVHKINHIDRDDDRDPEFGQLGRQVQVPFEVGAVEDVQDRVGALPDQVVPGDDLLECVRRERVDTGQVGDRHSVVPFQFSLFLFDRHPGPVPDELVGAGQGVEQRGFSAVGVPRQCDAHTRFSFLLQLPSANRKTKNNTGNRCPLFDLDHIGVGFADREFVAAQGDLDRIAERRDLPHPDLGPAGQSHVHDPPPHRALAVQPEHRGDPADRNVFQRFHHTVLLKS